MCGKKYKYCPHCKTDLKKPTWMTNFHDENCRNVYHSLVDFKYNGLPKKDAKAQLEKCDLSLQDGYSPSSKQILAEIQEEDSEISS
jgi:hypothetical protein